MHVHSVPVYTRHRFEGRLKGKVLLLDFSLFPMKWIFIVAKHGDVAREGSVTWRFGRPAPACPIRRRQ